MTDSDDVKRVVAETIALYFLQAAFVELADAFARIDADGALAALDAITGSSVAQLTKFRAPERIGDPAAAAADVIVRTTIAGARERVVNAGKSS
jgi:hypothetical protein